ncbi:hypothetical protein TH53_06615 [Pedobacter lusitanus]|uniref:Uncharacterized protein n=1 Tax=Pedobacter lusitanus TaxID=1503925 RepID=A0A0D0FZF9_9SPHI|nr:hypothetical protein [Pedobacter lusitanus]KIO77904.1 hypothetical protein TH53_06615 [Pedobacter lusitanus]
MRNKKINIFLGILVLVLVIWMLKGTFFQPGTGDLKAGFKEVAHYRNENNTGPVQYVFAVTVKDTIWSEMETYGNYKPHHKGGNTKVYYFMEGTQVPNELGAGKVNFDPKFNSSCVGLYEKSPIGYTSLSKQPFK